MAHETKFRRWSTFTPPQNTALAAFCGLFLLRRSYTGGSFRKNSSSLAGPLAEETLRDIHGDILFLGVDGFDLEIGLTTPNLVASRMNRAMVRSAATVIVVCDSTKFNRRSLSKIVDVTSIHHVITDSNLPAETAEAIRALNIQLTLV
jgi:DeoR family transcriptional regulator of aga operon